MADAKIESAGGLIERLRLIGEGGPALDDRRAIDVAYTVAHDAERLAQELRYACAFEPAAGAGLARLRSATRDAAVAALDALSGGRVEPLADHSGAISKGLDEVRDLADAYSFPEDQCVAAFGVPEDDLRDGNGIFSSTRLLSAFYGRYDDLYARLRRLLQPITNTPPALLSALWPALGLLLSERPLIALRTAFRVRDLLEAGVSAHVNEIARPLRQLKLSVDSSVDNHAGMVGVIRQLDQAESDLERARLKLDLYRRMVEGQLRPWAWTLLRIHGHRDGRVPTLASLRERLVANGDPLLADAARAMLPAARNAAAHEDASWDELRIVLRTDRGEVSVADLEDATERAYSFMLGAECAWACVRFASTAFAAALDAEDPPNGLRGISERDAVRHFGTNGLAVRRWTNERGVLTVLIDDLAPPAINPCFQAAMWASRLLERVERVVVTTADRQLAIMDLSRPALDATFLVWVQARAAFGEMPTCTFLPANAWARLAVETPDAAAKSAAWLALNDAVSAYDEAIDMMTPIAEAATFLAPRLDLAATAVAATMAVLPPVTGGPLPRVLRVTRLAGIRAALVARGGLLGPSAQLEAEIRGLHGAWSAVAPLPTLDRRPLA